MYFTTCSALVPHTVNFTTMLKTNHYTGLTSLWLTELDLNAGLTRNMRDKLNKAQNYVNPKKTSTHKPRNQQEKHTARENVTTTQVIYTNMG